VSIYARTTGDPKRRLRRLDDGILWHPAWGNRKAFREQAVEPGWFSGPCEAIQPRAREEIIKALDGITEKVAHG
jgi:hypothetical protein